MPSLTLVTRSNPQQHLQAIIFYERRCGTEQRQPFEASIEGEDTTSISTVKRLFVRFRAGDSDFEGKTAPKPWRTSSLSTLSRLASAVFENRMYPSSSPHWSPVPRIQKSTGSMDTSCLDRPHSVHRVSICHSLLLCSHGKELLEDLITGEEKWVLYDFLSCGSLEENTRSNAKWALTRSSVPMLLLGIAWNVVLRTAPTKHIVTSSI